MAENQSLEDRLRGHSEAFKGLLSLIPAKVYYGEDTSDQWKRKKQTKEEKRAAKLAKLDPANSKSALDILEENERKRKREDEEDIDDSGLERPREGLKSPKSQKKQRQDSDVQTAPHQVQPETSKEFQDQKKQRKELKKSKKESQRARQKAIRQEENALRERPKRDPEREEEAEIPEDEAEAGADHIHLEPFGLDATDKSTKPDEWVSDDSADGSEREKPEAGSGDAVDHASTASSSKADSPAFETPAQQSGTSSISSIGTHESSTLPGSVAVKNKALAADGNSSQRQSSLLNPATSALTMEEKQERLRKRIEELRAARKADIDGQPAKSRAELIESRRKKQDLRKERKKALRQQAKEEEQRQRDESLARGSPLMSPSIHSPDSGDHGNNFSFGTITFEGGQTMSADLSNVMDLSKRKGRSDVKTAALSADAKEARLASLDPAKRAEITEKEMWLNARKRVHGEKPKDEGSLLRKALKRKEKQKEKSASDWQQRLQDIKSGKDAKQKKREANLAKRKEDKGKSSKGGKVKKPKKRPGFEGSFRAGRKS